MHLNGVAFVQVLFQRLPLIHKARLVGIMFLVAQIFVTIHTVGEVRVFSESDVDCMVLVQMLRNVPVRSQVGVAILTKGHGGRC